MIIDTDVHVAPTPETLEPYMAKRSAAEYLSLMHPKTHVIVRAGNMADASPPGGGAEGSDLAFMSEELLDRYDIDVAILTPASALEIGEVVDLGLAAEFAHALNAWQVHECLPADPRYYGSIVIAPGDPDRAVDEIRTWASHPRMVQVFTSMLPCLMGDRFLHPIYGACNETGLPFYLHVGGSSSSAVSKIALGSPETFFESRTAMCLSALSHLISGVANGVFVKYPRLRCVFAEFGIGWLPWVMWRMDMEYRANREDVPWLTRKPSDYIRDFVRFTTQPLEESTGRRSDMITLLSLIEAEQLLMFSSDYPHWDFDDPDVIRRRLPESWHDPIFFQNAKELYQLPSTVPSQVVVT